jgi:hypothetical protein
MIGFKGGVPGDYTFHVDPDDPDTPKANVTINIPGEHLNNFPDYMSWENGILTVVEVNDVGDYIEGAVDGKFKDTQIGNGLPIQDMPSIDIHGTFKIYRKQ